MHPVRPQIVGFPAARAQQQTDIGEPAGTYPGVGTVTVTAEAETGYTLTGPDSFELTFSAAERTPVEAEAPTKVDDYGVADDTYTIAETPGVKYLVGGVVEPAGTYPGVGTVTVTAEAETGFTLTGPDSFELTFTATKATALTSTGVGPATHTVSPNVPSGAELVLLSAGGENTMSVTVPGEGTYVVDGNSLVFTPVLGFLGPADRSVNSDQDAHLNQQPGLPGTLGSQSIGATKRQSRLSHTRRSRATSELTDPG